MELAEFQRLCAHGKREFPWIDLRGQDLSGMNLGNTILREANLESAILVGVNLQNARLPKANLQRANLRGADLSCAKLRGANLRGADLSGANLTGADFRSSDLTGANLDGAILGYTNFCDAILTGVEWGTADRTQGIFASPPDAIETAIEAIVETAQTTPSNTLPEFQEKWSYKPEDLLTIEQKLALSPIVWLMFVGACYLYQGFACFSFLKQGFNWLFAGLAGTSPLLWLMSPRIYWSYPALLLGMMLFTSWDIFSFLFAAIALVLSFRGVIRYRSLLDKVQVPSFGQMPPQFQRRVIRDAVTLSSVMVVFITLFRSLFVQPAVAVFLLSSAMAAISGAIALNLMRDRQNLSPPLPLGILLITSWLGFMGGLGASYFNR